MIKDSWSDENVENAGKALGNGEKTTPYSLQPGRRNRDVSASQELIYDFLLEIVKSWQPDRVVEHFKNLFIYNLDTPQVPCAQALQDILVNNDQAIFLQTLKRSCYILINNWDHAQKGSHIQAMVESFEDPSIYRFALGDTTQRLRYWLRAFIESQDYQNLKIFARRAEEKKKDWSDRYAHYQLITQAEDLTNSTEQREAAKALTKQVQNRFRLDLALYVSRRQTPTFSTASASTSTRSVPERENPTGLGETTVNLIKSLVMRRGFFGPDNLARIFLEQVQNLSYESYKISLLNYLTYSSTEEEKKQKKGFAQLLKHRLSDRLNQLYPDKNSEEVSSYLMLRTCNQVINFLTTENNQDPSYAFLLFVSQGHSLLLAIVLLKIILISPDSRSHLDSRIAKLVQYYIRLNQEQDPENVGYFGYFLDIINVILAIYTEGVSYNILQPKDSPNPKPEKLDRLGTFGEHLGEPPPTNPSLETYRIFAQSHTVEHQGDRPMEQNTPKGSSHTVNQPSVPTPTPVPTPVPTKVTASRTILYDAVTGEEIIFEGDPLSL
jgi:hypothetical protein